MERPATERDLLGERVLARCVHAAAAGSSQHTAATAGEWTMRSVERILVIGVMLLASACGRNRDMQQSSQLPSFAELAGVTRDAICSEQFDPRWPESRALKYCETRVGDAIAFELRTDDVDGRLEYGRVWVIPDSTSRAQQVAELESWASRTLSGSGETVCVDGSRDRARRWLAAGYYLTVTEYGAANKVSITIALGKPPVGVGGSK